ncbi:MAG TPA: hypothetical protein VMB25_11860 [Bryobacteraceae bacterium]|nr:hypothetical protein [Bryobacteraceae bacterium]
MNIPLPQRFLIRREIHAIQHVGRSMLEPIPAGEVIVAERQSHYARMIEVVWRRRRFLVFERDLTERSESLGASVEDDPAPKLA